MIHPFRVLGEVLNTRISLKLTKVHRAWKIRKHTTCWKVISPVLNRVASVGTGSSVFGGCSAVGLIIVSSGQGEDKGRITPEILTRVYIFELLTSRNV